MDRLSLLGKTVLHPIKPQTKIAEEYRRTGKVLAFTTTIPTADKIKEELQKVHGIEARTYSSEERKHGDWFIHTRNGVLLSTTAFGMGMNIRHLLSVIMLGVSLTMCDFAQGFGRGCREDESKKIGGTVAGVFSPRCFEISRKLLRRSYEAGDPAFARLDQTWEFLDNASSLRCCPRNEMLKMFGSPFVAGDTKDPSKCCRFCSFKKSTGDKSEIVKPSDDKEENDVPDTAETREKSENEEQELHEETDDLQNGVEEGSTSHNEEFHDAEEDESYQKGGEFQTTGTEKSMEEEEDDSRDHTQQKTEKFHGAHDEELLPDAGRIPRDIYGLAPFQAPDKDDRLRGGGGDLLPPDSGTEPDNYKHFPNTCYLASGAHAILATFEDHEVGKKGCRSVLEDC